MNRLTRLFSSPQCRFPPSRIHLSTFELGAGESLSSLRTHHRPPAFRTACSGGAEGLFCPIIMELRMIALWES
ncbi:MAG: hypothetical protein ACE5LC_02300 [Candidatus Aminicenantales bacterium]